MMNNGKPPGLESSAYKVFIDGSPPRGNFLWGASLQGANFQGLQTKKKSNLNGETCYKPYQVMKTYPTYKKSFVDAFLQSHHA